MKPLVNTADYLQQTLLPGLEVTDEDRKWNASFKKGFGGRFLVFQRK
jgi:hypothetical protein